MTAATARCSATSSTMPCPSRPTGSRILVELSRESRNGPFVVTIDDEGQGIPEDNLESIFQRFYSERPTEHFGQHSGLGLSICRQIVETYGGTIAATNRRGPDGKVLGARFTVRAARGQRPQVTISNGDQGHDLRPRDLRRPAGRQELARRPAARAVGRRQVRPRASSRRGRRPTGGGRPDGARPGRAAAWSPRRRARSRACWKCAASAS